MSAVPAAHGRTKASVSDRLLAAVPLASIYLWLSIVYCVEAWKRATPWLFTDELEFTQLSRSVAATGHAARRGEPHSFHSLYILMIAPFWRIADVAAAFAAIKYFDVLVMTAVVFPTYFLARLIVDKTPALFAAAAAGLIPSLAYSSWIVEEVLAYPYAALCFFLIAKSFVTRSRRWIGVSLAASALAPVVRGELAMIPVTFGLTGLFMVWSSEWARRRRENWTRSDWLGFLVLVAGAIILFSGVMSHHSTGWLRNTAYNWTKQRIFVYGDWAAGALAVGIGAAPLAIGLASLFPARGEARTLGLRVFRSVATAAVIAFGIYTGMKGAYLSQTFASRSEERNLIYICPLLFVGMAHVVARRRINVWALSAATAYTAYLVLGVPYFIGGGIYSDALGLAIVEQGNRYLLLGETHARYAVAFALAVGVVGVALLPRLRGGAATALAVTLSVGALAWTATGEIAAAAGNVTISRDIRPTLGTPFTWVDDATHLKPTLYLGQQVSDPNAEYLLEFWNRSITTVSSLDGSILGPGPSGAPNITPTGQLYWTPSPANPGKLFDFAVEELPCINFAGTTVVTHPYRGGVWRLVQLTKPNRLRAVCSGIYSDGWSGQNDSTYFRFVGRRPGWLRITLTRTGFKGSPVDIQLGSIVQVERSPTVGRVNRHVHAVVPDDGTTVVWVRTPAAPFAARTVILDKFVPSQVNPGSSDGRTLGAKVTYRWFLTKG